MTVQRLRGHLLLITGAALLGACEAQAQDPLLADELVYTENNAGWLRKIKIDSSLASFPPLVRQLRATQIAAFDPSLDACGMASGDGCLEITKFELEYEGTRLVSLLESTHRYGGGAHSLTRATDHLYDLKSAKRLRFDDIFTSWPQARAILQSAFCRDLSQYHPDAEECPAIEKQAITLGGYEYEIAKAVFVTVTTQDYALGTYALGQATISIEVTNNLYDLIKPEYREDFQKPPAY